MADELPPLGLELRRLRMAAQLSGPQLAPMLGMSQAQVSRFETGSRQPNLDDVIGWMNVCKSRIETLLSNDPGPSKRAELEAALTRINYPTYRTMLERLFADASAEVVSNYVIYRTGLKERQEDLITMDERAAGLRHFQPLLIPGPLQTVDFARGVFLGFGAALPEADAAAEARMRRTQQLLDRSVQYHVIVTEGVFDIRLRHVDGGTRGAVLAHVLAMAQRNHVTVQVIDRTAVWEHAPMGGFLIYDFTDQPSIALVETYAAQVELRSGLDIARHNKVWDQLSAMAMSPAESLAWLRNVGT